MLKRLASDELLKDSALLFAGMAVMHVCNLAYQMVMGRVLPEEEFALLASLLGALVIINRPLGTLSVAVGHHVSLIHRENRSGDAQRLAQRWFFRMLIPGVVTMVAVIMLIDPITGFFNLSRKAPVITAAIAIPAMMVAPVLVGTMQGGQRFGMLALAHTAGALSRLLLGAVFVLVIYPAAGWALLGHSLSLYAGSGLMLLVILRSRRTAVRTSAPNPRLRFYLLQSLPVQIGYAVLFTADVILVKHLLPEQAGDFAYAATMSRMVVFLPVAIAATMFPKVSAKGIGTQHQHHVFKKAFSLTALSASAVVTVVWLFPDLLLAVLFGLRETPSEMLAICRGMSVVMLVSALLNLVVQFLLAQRRFAPAQACIPAAIAYAVLVFFYHDSLMHFVIIGFLANGLAFSVCLIEVFFPALSSRISAAVKRQGGAKNDT